MFTEEEANRLLGIPGPEAEKENLQELLAYLKDAPEVHQYKAIQTGKTDERNRLMKAVQEGRAGISKKTGFICLMEDEPDAILIPYSSIFDPNAGIKAADLGSAEAAPEYKPKLERISKGSNYTAPKKKRKQKARNGRK